MMKKVMSLILAFAMAMSLMATAFATTGGSEPVAANPEDEFDLSKIVVIADPNETAELAEYLKQQESASEPTPQPTMSIITPDGEFMIVGEEYPEGFLDTFVALNELVMALVNVYYLEPRLRTLDDYNSVRSWIQDSSITTEKPIWTYLSKDTQEKIKDCSAHQALLVIQGTTEYSENEQLRKQVDRDLEHLVTYPRGFMIESMELFYSKALMKDLDPDSLSVLGHFVVENERFQDLAGELKPYYADHYSMELLANKSVEEVGQAFAQLRAAVVAMWINP